jgi:hypothetical protein
MHGKGGNGGAGGYVPKQIENIMKNMILDGAYCCISFNLSGGVTCDGCDEFFNLSACRVTCDINKFHRHSQKKHMSGVQH